MQFQDPLGNAKKALRAKTLERRDQIPGTDRDRWGQEIEFTLLDLPEVHLAHTVFCFISSGSEVPTHALIDRLLVLGKVVLVPRIPRGEPMRAVMFPGWSALAPGTLGILAPPDGPSYDGMVDVVVTPGVAFSVSGDRLGYGRGYYDRWFSENQHGTRIGIAFDCQIADSVPVDDCDVPVRRLITPTRLVSCPPRD